MDTLLHEQGGYHPYLISKPKSPAAVAQGIAPAAVAQGVCRRGGVVKGYVGAERDHAPTPGGALARADPHPLYNRGSEIFEILKVFTLVR